MTEYKTTQAVRDRANAYALSPVGQAKRKAWYQKNKRHQRELERVEKLARFTRNPHRERAKQWICDMKRSRYGYDPALTLDILIAKMEATPDCEICGVELIYGHTPRPQGKKCHPRVASKDRVDSRLGYSEANLGITCWSCNQIKSDMTLHVARGLVKYMEERMGI